MLNMTKHKHNLQLASPFKVDVHEVRLPCNHCGKTFAGESRLNDHVSSIHTPDEEKPHRCTVCGRGFGRPDKLHAHVKVVHENIKDVLCRHGCGARFSCSGNRNLHEKNKHGGVVIMKDSMKL